MSNLRELLKEAREFVYARERDDDLRARIDAALAEPDELEALRAEVERLRATLREVSETGGLANDLVRDRVNAALAAAPAKEPPDPLRDPRVLLAACLLHPLPLSLSSAIKEVLAAAPAKESAE